jgi:hypothetical protein
MHCCKCDEIQVDEMGRICSKNEDMSNAYRLLARKPRRKILLAGTWYEYDD